MATFVLTIAILLVVGLTMWIPHRRPTEHATFWCGVALIIIGLTTSIMAPYYNEFGTLRPGNGLDFSLSLGNTFLTNAFLLVAAIGANYVASAFLRRFQTQSSNLIGRMQISGEVRVSEGDRN